MAKAPLKSSEDNWGREHVAPVLGGNAWSGSEDDDRQAGIQAG